MTVHHNKEPHASEHVRMPVSVGTLARRAVFSFHRKAELGPRCHMPEMLHRERREHKVHGTCPTGEGSVAIPKSVSDQSRHEKTWNGLKSYRSHIESRQVLPKFRNNPQDVCDVTSKNHETEKKGFWKWPGIKMLSAAAQGHGGLRL